MISDNPYHGRPPYQQHSTTSKEAATSMEPNLGHLQAVVLAHLRSCGAWGATDEEMQTALEMAQNTQRPRRRELQLKQLVCDSGQKRPTRSNRQAVVWIIKATFQLEFSP